MKKEKNTAKKNNISKLAKSNIKTYSEFCQEKESEEYALTKEEIEYYTSISMEEKKSE